MYRNTVTLFLALIIAGCGGGGGGSAPQSTSTKTSTPTSTVTQVNCTNPHTADYPVIFNGPWPTPTPADKLDTKIVRSLGFKDYYAGMYYGSKYGTDKNCTKDEYVKLMYTETLDRMQKLHITRAWLYNFAHWQNATAENLTITRQDWEIPETYVTFIVTEAKKRGIEIYLSWQFSDQESSGTKLYSTNTVMTQASMQRIMDAHSKVMLDVAAYAQSVGIAGLSVDWSGNTFTGMNQYQNYMNDRYVTLVDQIRSVYKGKLVFGTGLNVAYYQPLFDKVDMIMISLDPKLYSIENINMSVENVEAGANRNLENLYKWGNYSKLANKPVILRLFAQSRDKFFVEGWVEDGFCVTGTTSTGQTNSCIQETYTTDFSVQAVGIEGMLRAIDKQTLFNIESVQIEAYWLSDTLTPGDVAKGGQGFPNLSQSIRGKPAEKIVEYWYSK